MDDLKNNKRFLQVKKDGNDIVWVSVDKIVEIRFKDADWLILVCGAMGMESYLIKQGDPMGIDVRRLAMGLT